LYKIWPSALWALTASCRASAPSCMVRNLSMVNKRPPSPTRVWRKRIGPGLSRLTASAIRPISGSAGTNSSNVSATSKTRLTTRWNGSSTGSFRLSRGIPPKFSMLTRRKAMSK